MLCQAYCGVGCSHLNQPEKAYSLGNGTSTVVLTGSLLTYLEVCESTIRVVYNGTFPPLSGDGFSDKN
jgi:hypothetical protein